MWKDMAVAGYAGMIKAMERYGYTHSYSSLNPKLNGANPDDCVSSIPYEKGFRFLMYLEGLVTPANYKNLFRAYVEKYKMKSIITQNYRDHFEEWVTTNMGDKAKDIISKVDWKTWIEVPGIPPVV